MLLFFTGLEKYSGAVIGKYEVVEPKLNFDRSHKMALRQTLHVWVIHRNKAFFYLQIPFSIWESQQNKKKSLGKQNNKQQKKTQHKTKSNPFLPL